MKLDEKKIYDLLWLAYSSAYITTSGKQPDDFTLQQFDQFYKLNQKVIQVKTQANVVGSDIFVHPVTPNIERTNDPALSQRLMFETYAGWEGKITGNAKNGNSPAYWVRISSNGVHYIHIPINVDDIQPLENKRYYNYE